MHRYISIGLLFGGALITLLSYIFRDQLVLDRPTFAFWVALTRITSFSLLLFMSILLIALGKRFISKRFYWFGLFLVPALIPNLHHILSFVFFPDFITKNTRDKVAYLFLISRVFVLLAFFLEVLPKGSYQWSPCQSYGFVLALSITASFYIVLFYNTLPPLYIEGIGQPFYRDLFDLITIALYVYFAFYVIRNRFLGEESSWYIFTVFGFLSLSSLSLALYKHFYDSLIVLASLHRLFAYILLLYVILYINIRKEAIDIMNEVAGLLRDILRIKPTKEGDLYLLKLEHSFRYLIKALFLYDLEKGKPVAAVYGPERVEVPGIDLSSIKKLVKDLGGQYFHREAHYNIYENYLIVSLLKAYPESPLAKLHVLNTERTILGYLLNWINFDKLIEEKTRELDRLYLLLETSEYATQAYNNIDTFSKQVFERLDYILNMDGSVFYMWNKNAELPERIVFSSGFLANFPDIKTYELLKEVIESSEMYGMDRDYMYCKFEENFYQSGMVGLRRGRSFDKEELLFFKTVGNQLFHVVRLMKVIEDLKKAQASIRLLTEYDPLTMLYNRKSFEKIFEREIERTSRSGEPLCLLFMDVDNLRVINNTYGYFVGDLALKHVAELIKRKTRKFDIAGRLGADEFGILLPRTNKMTAESIAERLRQEIADTPLVVGKDKIHVNISVGIVCYPFDAEKKEEIFSLGEALIALIKREGKGKVKKVEEPISKMLPALRKVEKEILEAFEKRAVDALFQEILNVHTNTVEGFEALMRLYVDGGFLPVGDFIRRAEEMGVIRELDKIMVEKIFEGASRFKNKDFFLFVNLSPQNLTEDYMKWVVSMVEKYGIKSSRLVFEITEREAIQDIVEVGNFIKGMKEFGFKFAIDDFGSGYASFLYLKYLHVDFLKIEGEFIKSLKDSMIDRSFVRSIVDIAKTLGIKTIAEQVEDEETLNILLSLGVDYAQGYYIGRPAPMEEKIKAYFSKETDQ